MAREVRPSDDDYFEHRLDLLSQGDLFRDVPLAYPTPARQITEEVESADGGTRMFVSGPLDFGMGLLITPTCSMRAEDVQLLDVLVDFRNAVVHGNESELAVIIATGDIKATMTSYKAHRQVINRLTRRMDRLIADDLAAILGVQAPC